MNSHLNNVTRPLNLFEWNAGYSTADNDPGLTVVKAILKYEDHPSKIKIRSNYNADLNFKFKEIPVNEVYEMILKLDCSKKTSGSIPNKILKSYVSVIYPYVTGIINK